MYWRTNARSNPYVYVMVLTKTNWDEMGAKGRVDRVVGKRGQYAGRYQGNWKRICNGIIAPSTLDDHRVLCVVCSNDVNGSVSTSQTHCI